MSRGTYFTGRFIAWGSRLWLCLLLTLLMQTPKDTSAQRVSDWLRLAQEAKSEGDHFGALRYLDEVMAMDSAKSYHNYLYADALRLNHRYAKAAFYYYKVYRRDQGHTYPEAGPWLAAMQKQTGDYAEAKKTWRRVRDQFASQPDSYWHLKAIQEMRSCDLASVWMEEVAGFEMEAMPDGINTHASEFAGTISPGGHLVFSSLRGSSDAEGRIEDAEAYRTQLFIAEGPNWQQTRAIKLIPEAHAEANFAVNADSTLAALTVVTSEGKQEIYISGQGSASSWQRLLPQHGADSAYYSHPAFGKVDGREVLFFTSDREGGEGMLDIWYLDLEAVGTAPVNPGRPLNTPGNEVSPFYRNDKEQLYFASDWHHGFGGFDLFSTEMQRGAFSMPVNLKKPWNTPSNDLYYTFDRSAGMGTVTSNRPEALHQATEGCCNDLWLFAEAPYEYEDTLHIRTIESLNDYLPVTLYFHNDEPNPRTTSDTTALSYFESYYAYADLLPEYQSAYRAGLNEDAGIDAEEAMDKFFLDNVDKGSRDLSFFTPLLLEELREGQHIQLTVKGFASPLARTDYNVKLTSRRIASLINHLYQYDGGAFAPFLDGSDESDGRLEIIKIPFGEYTARSFVSDNPNENNAIWSIAAALERKIEISSVQRAPADTATAAVTFASEIADLGTLREGDIPKFSFTFEVGEGMDFQIDTLVYDSAQLYVNEVASSYEAATRDHRIEGICLGPPFGKLQYSIRIYGNVAGGWKELNVVLEVVR